MQLDVRGVAAMLNVPPSTIYRWINEKRLPAKGVEGQYRFARTELLEWATVHKVELSLDIFHDGTAGSARLSLVEALESGGIFYNVPGSDKSSALRSVVDNMSLPDGSDPELLLELFLAREATGSTAVGNGIAIPHPRHPVVLPVVKPTLCLCFLAKPIDFAAANGEPVHTLFVLLSPTIQLHLQMLARVASLLRDDRFQQVLAHRKPRKEILTEVRRVEKAFERSSPANN
ncbi:MAG: PTS sugar transporter subunit IIA [Planctomycetia bacterium]|nr:PTS sugar transporter subunit IIA [Planctomycetia bacterium]